MLTHELPANVRAVVAAAATLGPRIPGIVAVAMVGSWARATGREDSDVDLVVLTTAPTVLLHDDEWFSSFGEGAPLVRSKDFGLLRERRLRRRDGLEVEVGFGGPSWADIPSDPGTARVVRDGMEVLFDPRGMLVRLAAAVARAPRPPGM